jgi:hypothetical protein
MKHWRHDKIVNDFENTKRKHLKSLANRMLKKQDFLDKLKTKPISDKFLNKF